MKIFVYKVIFIMVCIFFLFNFTIGYQIRKVENRITNISSTEKISKIKEKLKKEMNSAVKKDKIFKEDDKLLIKRLIKKIILELELNQIN
jgi:predicted PurR-regulated permease PerM